MDLIKAYNKGNKFGKENNLKLKVISKGHIEYTMQLEEKHMALENVVHGGAIAGFMDAVLSVAAFSAVAEENNHVATVEFKINYLKAVRSQVQLKGIGKIIKHGRRLVFTEGQIYNEKNDLVATGSGTIMKIE